MNIDELTIGDLKKLQSLVGCAGDQSPDTHPYPVGKNVFIRTVTHYWVGHLVNVFKHELVLESAGWVADTGRFSEMDLNGTLNEVEVVQGRRIIGRGAVIDCGEWRHALPTETK